jgi:threonine/homoserine/homoserine lactone efflux protein
MIFLTGIGLGFLLSCLPGPASMSIIRAATDGRRQVIRCLGALLLGDLMVFFFAALIYFQLKAVIDGNTLRILAGLFLTSFALVSLTRASKTSGKKRNTQQTFFLTLISPGVWLANFGIIALASAEGWAEVSVYFLGLQTGVVAWFLLVTGWFTRQSPHRQQLFQRACLGLMLIVGIGSILRYSL